MWCLISPEGVRLYLHPNAEVTFGRRKADILLLEDDSVSRLHASIYVEPKDVIVLSEPISICKLKDMGSKYGTYVMREEEWIRVSTEEYNLKNQDTVRFGLLDQIFTVVYLPIIVVVSNINDNDKHKLKSLLDEIDGIISLQWTSSCTHLTVSKATLTEKVTWAMASAVPIVTMDYWEKVQTAVKKGKKLPNPNNYVPAIEEALVNNQIISLAPNEKRKILFQNLIFVFFNDTQCKTYGKMIKMAGGKYVLYMKKPLSLRELCAVNVIMVQYTSSDATQSTQTIIPEYAALYKKLHEHGRRMISETEIPLAILHCSIDKYCNIMFKFAEFLKRPQSKVASDSSEVLALDTQDVTPDVQILPKVISDVVVKTKINPRNLNKIIPDTYEFSSQNLLNVGHTNSCEENLNSAKPLIEETQNTVTDIVVVEEIEQNAIHHKENVVYIPETNDSSFSNCTQKDTQCILNTQPSKTQRNKDTQEIELSKVSMIVNKGTPFKKTITLNIDEDNELEEIQPSTNKRSKDIAEFPTQKKSAISEVSNTKERTSEVQIINLQEKRDIQIGRKDDKNSEVTSQTMQGSKRNLKRKSSDENINNDKVILLDIENICSDTFNMTNIKRLQPCASSTFIEDQESDNSNLKKNLSPVQVNRNQKKFKKVYNIVPKKRITLCDMYVWGKNS
ncbi:NBN [Anthophora quadrimaculata]